MIKTFHNQADSFSAYSSIPRDCSSILMERWLSKVVFEKQNKEILFFLLYLNKLVSRVSGSIEDPFFTCDMEMT